MDSYGNFKRGDQRCSCKCHWDWSELNACFAGSRISLSDIDCLFVVERGMDGFERGKNLKKMGLKFMDPFLRRNYPDQVRRVSALPDHLVGAQISGHADHPCEYRDSSTPTPRRLSRPASFSLDRAQEIGQ